MEAANKVEAASKVKELEDELKILKAEIRNVLLDIREFMLDGSNPLAQDQESAYLRMDLNTTARAVAAEAASREAAKAAEQAKGEEDTEDEPEEPEASVSAGVPPEGEAAEQAEGGEHTEDKPEEPEASLSAGSPRKRRASRKGKGKEQEASPEATAAEPSPGREASLEPTGVPMFPAYLLPTGGIDSLAAWAAEAMTTIGPQQLERVIAVRRLWGNLPPGTCEALAHLQELVSSSEEGQELSWLEVLRALERLTPS